VVVNAIIEGRRRYSGMKTADGPGAGLAAELLAGFGDGGRRWGVTRDGGVKQDGRIAPGRQPGAEPAET